MVGKSSYLANVTFLAFRYPGDVGRRGQILALLPDLAWSFFLHLHPLELLCEGLWADLGTLLPGFKQGFRRTNKLPRSDPIPLL